MRVDPAALRTASANACGIADEIPRLAERVTSGATEAAAGCPGFAVGDALVQVATAWQSRLTAVGGQFAESAAKLADTADNDEQADRSAAHVLDGAGR